MRGKAEREAVLARLNILFEQTEETIFISSTDGVIVLPRSKIVTVDYDQTSIVMMTTGQCSSNIDFHGKFWKRALFYL